MSFIQASVSHSLAEDNVDVKNVENETPYQRGIITVTVLDRVSLSLFFLYIILVHMCVK